MPINLLSDSYETSLCRVAKYHNISQRSLAANSRVTQSKDFQHMFTRKPIECYTLHMQNEGNSFLFSKIINELLHYYVSLQIFQSNSNL